MAEIDPVILQLRAEMDQYLGTLRSTTTKVDQLLGTQEKKVKQLEAQFKRSSGEISGSLKGLAGSLATYFTGRELISLIDNFTRLQNSLRVAGLEGQNLATVQERLYAIGAKYGTSVNALADLYSKNSQLAKDLGASQQQLLTITESSAQALKITGVSTEQASGAILGLTQALASGRVKAEEFNQINEGGLRPLLQAAAASERWGGSVNKLRADIVSGKVSSQEFFAAILAGSQQLEGQASKATLTLSGSLQVLTDQLSKYVASASSANGITGALSEGIAMLAKNLDTVIPAIAVLGAALGVGFVANAIRARLAMAAITAAELGMAGGAATAGVAVGTLGRSLLMAFGGPVGLAITAIGVAIYYLTGQIEAADQAARQKANADLRMAEASRVAEMATNQLTNASEKERAALIASMQASRARAAQALQTAKAQLAEAKAAIAVARANAQRQLIDATSDSGGSMDTTAAFMGDRQRQSKINTAQAKADAAEAAAARAEGALEGLDRAIAAATAPIRLAPAGGGKAPKGRKGPKGSGPTAEETAQRHAEEMGRLDMETLRARHDLATDAGERADLEKDMLHLERDQRIAQIEADKNFTRAQKDAQIAKVKAIYGTDAVTDKDGNIVAAARPSLGAQAINREFERRQTELALAMIDAEESTLGSELDIEQSISKRQDIERKMLALQQEAERIQLEQKIADGGILDAKQARAQLERKQLADSKRLALSQQTPGQKFLYDINGTALNINDAIQSIEVQGLERLNDGLVDAIMNAKSLGDVFKNVANQIIGDLLRIAIQQTIIKPLAERLFGGGGGGGGGIAGAASSILSIGQSIFGRASGGYVAPGQMVRVNEAAMPGKVEGFMSRSGGDIIPLGRMNAVQGGGQSAGGTVRIMIEEGPNFFSTIRTEAEGVSVEVVRAAAPTLIDASVNATMARANRRKM